MLHVLDGSHATDRLQIGAIEGFDRQTNPNWVVRRRPTDSSIIEIINLKTAVVAQSGTELYSILTDLSAQSDFLDGHTIVIRPDATPYNAGESQANFTKDVNIFGYGAKICGGSSVHTNGGALRQTTHNKSIRVYGLSFDSTDTISSTKKLGTFIGGGSLASGYTTKLCHVRDCTFNNMFSYGINVQAKDNGTDAAPDESTCIVENCRFDAGSSDSNNEHILTNGFKYLRVSNCSFYGNKTMYCSAQYASVNNCYSSAQGFTEGYGIELQSEDASVVNTTMVGGGIGFRPWTSVHWGATWGPNKRINVYGYTNRRLSASYAPIELTGLDQTYIIGHVTIDGFYINTGKAVTANLNQSPTHSRILSLIIRNGYIGAFDTGASISTINDHSVDYMIVQNVKTPTWSSGAPVRLFATQGTCDIDYLNIKDIYPVPATNMISQSTSSTFTNTVKAAAPLSNGANTSESLGAGGAKTLQFFSNRGKQTLSGDGSTLVFNIPHNLVSTPVYAQITAGSSQANRDFHVTVGATNVVVNFASAPASGSNNTVLYWSAVSS